MAAKTQCSSYPLELSKSLKWVLTSLAPVVILPHKRILISLELDAELTDKNQAIPVLKIIIIYLKFQFNWASWILSDNSKRNVCDPRNGFLCGPKGQTPCSVWGILFKKSRIDKWLSCSMMTSTTLSNAFSFSHTFHNAFL